MEHKTQEKWWGRGSVQAGSFVNLAILTGLVIYKLCHTSVEHSKGASIGCITLMVFPRVLFVCFFTVCWVCLFFTVCWISGRECAREVDHPSI